MLLYYSLAIALSSVSLSVAQDAAQSALFSAQAAAASGLPTTQKWPENLWGTWSTKSLSTLTGPGFYDPFSETLIEPEHTGISYSFTGDGYYEEAYFRALANPSDPSCPEGLMQWQHGTYFVNATGALYLQPIIVDGRQLLSNPCAGDNALFLRYNQSELFIQYTQFTDPYHNVPRLDLYQWNGAPMNPMYLVYSPPQMLPTTTLTPITSSSPSANSKAKRGLQPEVPLNWKNRFMDNKNVVQKINADRLWWIGLGMTGVGGLLYLGPRRLGWQM